MLNDMENNRFFKFLWRANAVFIFGAALIAIFSALIFTVFVISEFRSYDAAPPPIVDDKMETNIEDNLSIRIPYSPETVGQYTYFELRAGEDTLGKLSSYSKSQIRNLAIFDLEANETKWVFEGSQQEIEKYERITKSVKSDTGKSTRLTVGFLLTVATSRSDKSVNRDIWAMSPNGSGLQKIIPNVSGKIDTQTYGNNETRIIIEKINYVEIYPIDVNSLSVGKPVIVRLP